MIGWTLALMLAAPFEYNDPGVLVPGSGQGAAESTVFAPGMRFPIEEGPAYPNSQVWGVGGFEGPAGGQCDVANYSYPWWDNYCETRSWSMPLCPAGVGHQGQDIRPATCDDDTYWTVAAEAGTVTNIGSYSVYVTAADGTRFDYLHGRTVSVSSGQGLAKGERINRVSNAFGGTSTTIHLHFNIRQDVAGLGPVYVSPYMSLVESYEALLGIDGGGETGLQGTVGQTDCVAITGSAHDPDQPQDAVPVELYFDGARGDPGAVGISATSDPDLGFEIEIPRSLRDDASHDVFVYAGDTELEGSPTSFACPAPAIPGGVRRLVGADELAAWGLSPFWDAATVDVATLNAIELGSVFPAQPVLARAKDSQSVWWIDPGYRRSVSAPAAEAWDLDFADVQVWPDHILSDLQVGPPLRAEVFLVRTAGAEIYVVDDREGAPGGGTGGDTGSDDGDGEGGGTAGDAGETGSGAQSGEVLDEGCGCRGGRGGLGALWLLAVLGLWARRRAVH